MVPLVLVIRAPRPAAADESAEPPTSCAGTASCVIDVDVPVPDGVVVPGDDVWPVTG